MAKKEDKDLITTIRERFKIMLEADEENRREAMNDMKFINIPGEQWDENMKQERGDRPCYEFNKLRVTCKRIINDMRANENAAKVRGVEGGDKDTAETIEGLIRNIWNMSDAETVVDYASEYMVDAGMGAWRISTDYASPMSFDQDIKIEAIYNPFCLFADPSAKDPMRRDADDWLLTEKIPTHEYEKRWPKAKVVEFESHEFDDDEDWNSEEGTRIAEYWYKVPHKKEIWQLQDGKVIDSESEEAPLIEQQSPQSIKKRRMVDTHKIMMCIASGEAILEGPTEWAGTQFPFIMVFGEYMVIDGKTYWHGAGRFAKDAQRSYNVSRTSITETIAQAPQAKWWTTVEQARGNDTKWAEAHKKNFPFLLYNADPKAPGPPMRMGGADVPVALIQESQIASEEINMVTGRYQNDVGAPNAATSGRQEAMRNQQGEIATYNFPDNRSKAIQRTYELLVDLIPKVYDTERELRILGSDGQEDYVRVNTFVMDETGQPVKVKDLNRGRYDVTVTSGPSFTTKRQEASEIYQQLTQGNPAIFPLIGDLIFKSMDLPYSEDIAERLQTMLPPPIQQMLNKDNKEIPPEAMQMMQQAEQAMQMVQEQMQQVQQAAQESDMAKAEVEKLMANLKTEEARFEAKIAKEVARLAERDAKFTINVANKEKEDLFKEGEGFIEGAKTQANEQITNQFAQSVQAIHEMAAQFNEFAAKTIEEIKQDKDEKPKIVKITSKRVNGTLEAIPVYENELPEQASE